MVTLGAKVEDTISGFRGVITAMTYYENGNKKACVEAMELDAGKPIAEQWFDVYRLRLMDHDKPKEAGFKTPCS